MSGSGDRLPVELLERISRSGYKPEEAISQIKRL